MFKKKDRYNYELITLDVPELREFKGEGIVGKRIRFDSSSREYSGNREYDQIFIENVFKHLNDRIQLFGFVSIETINLRLGITSDPDDIDALRVYHQNGNKKLYPALSMPGDPYMGYDIIIYER